MKMKIALMILFAAGVASVLPAWAFPTQTEMKTATDVVGDLVADDVRAANSGKAKREAVADKILALVDQAETDAAKWVLYKHAFIQYARAGQFEKAGEVLADTLAAFPDVPPQTVIPLIEKNCAKANAKNAPAVARIRKLMFMRQKCGAIVASPKASQKEKAEAHCLMGDWKKGLKMFESLGGKAAEMAAAETSGKQPKHVVANYWWDYECALDTCDQFKVHAAEIYKAGLADGSIAGLYKNVAEKRIAEMEAVPQAAAIADKAGNDELSKLKKICNTKGLVHCWRFNGTLKDVVGKSDAQCCGNARIDDKQASLFGGSDKTSNSCIDLGSNIIPNNGRSVTIELWATQKSIENSARILSFENPSITSITMCWTYCSDIKGCQIFVWEAAPQRGNAARVPDYYGLAPFDLDTEYHIALVFECCSDLNWKLHIYKQDAQTGRTIKKVTQDIRQGWSLKEYETPSCLLGRACKGSRGANVANASYNEVRIWNRALDEKELTQNAIKFYKAGETMKKD